MSNSYGFNGSIPNWAVYGLYDIENGEWVGQFYTNLEEAQKIASELGDDEEHLCVMSTTDETDIL